MSIFTAKLQSHLGCEVKEASSPKLAQQVLLAGFRVSVFRALNCSASWYFLGNLPRICSQISRH